MVPMGTLNSNIIDSRIIKTRHDPKTGLHVSDMFVGFLRHWGAAAAGSRGQELLGGLEDPPSSSIVTGGLASMTAWAPGG